MEENPSPVFSSAIENDFKIAQVLQMQKRADQAIKKYQYIISSFETIAQQEPISSIDYSIAVLSIGHLVEIYKNQNELDKALSLLSIQKKFIEYISATKSAYSNNDKNEDQELINLHHRNILVLFDELNATLKMPSVPPKKNPEEIINDFLNEKKKQDSKVAEQNMLRLLKLVEEKKKRLENSRFERWTDWINNNPIAILVFAMVFLGLFLLFIFTQFKLDDKPNRKMNKQTHKKSNGNDSKNKDKPSLNSETAPKLTKEEFKKLSEKFKKIGNENFQQTLNEHKSEFDSFVDQMKKRHQKNFSKSQEL